MVTVTDVSAADAESVLALYRDHPGWEDRSLDDVRRALANTDLAVGLRDDGREEEYVKMNYDC